ncbi:hypothetical protein PSH85_20445 [Pseudomonas simiae]|uniref:hypothetical protein n=1 Tax=Pseudomonas simiae TaxID=321846 RepID=UPI002733BD5B|nr:hypothetical protein [Pseudomonas simiae]WLG32699.1 hypothetical protein PSH82_20415 [Pseudomonas simiae]WLI22690.1 hypothetical protein PSH85_20445 [Pseudomonas simiae]
MLALFLCGLIVMTSIIGGVISFSPVPYWDMWDGYIDFYSKVLAGDYSAWWAPHNEHRIVLSRLFFWGDIRWFGGLSYSLIVINYLLAAAGCIVFVQFLNEAFKPLPNKSTRPFFMCVLVGWLFCWSQHENFTVGFQSQFFMAQLLPLCAFYFIYKMSSAPEKSTQYFVIASIFGVLAAGTMANGIITMPLLLLYGLFCRIGWRKNTVLCVFAIICISFYFYKAPAKESSLLHTLLSDPLGIAHYIFVYIGNPFYYIAPFSSNELKVAVAAVAGLLFIVIVTILAYFNIRSSRKNYLHLSLLLFILYIGGTALGTAGGRLEFGVAQASSSRYTTPALMVWAALSVMLIPIVSRWAEKYRVILPVFLMLLVALILGQTRALGSKNNEHFERLVAALALELNISDSNQIIHVYPRVERALQVAKVASEHNISIFGAKPIIGAKEKIGTLSNRTDGKKCLGSIDQFLPIDGEASWVTVNGWIYDEASESVPRSVVILDQKNIVVGYAITGGDRKDVAKLEGAGAAQSKLQGYVLKNSLGAQLKVISGSSCYFNIASTPVLYSFSSVKPDMNATGVTTSAILQGTDWSGSDSWRSKIDGLTVMGSFRQSDSDTGSIVLRMKRGDKLLYRSGPTGGRQRLELNGDPSTASILPIAAEWVALDFSQDQLPQSFTVKLSDDGDAWGEWSAIALKTEHN